MPNFETERTSCNPFTPPRVYSSGKVISCSTGSGANAGATVLIWTWTGVVSGKASSGNCAAARTPRTIRMAASNRTTKRFFRLNPIRALSMGSRDLLLGWSIVVGGAEAVLEQFGLEHKGPGRHDALAGLQ